MVDPLNGKILCKSDALRAGPGPIVVSGTLPLVMARQRISIKEAQTTYPQLPPVQYQRRRAPMDNDEVHQPDQHEGGQWRNRHRR